MLLLQMILRPNACYTHHQSQYEYGVYFTIYHLTDNTVFHPFHYVLDSYSSTSIAWNHIEHGILLY